MVNNITNIEFEPWRLVYRSCLSEIAFLTIASEYDRARARIKQANQIYIEKKVGLWTDTLIETKH